MRVLSVSIVFTHKMEDVNLSICSAKAIISKMENVNHVYMDTSSRKINVFNQLMRILIVSFIQMLTVVVARKVIMSIFSNVFK